MALELDRATFKRLVLLQIAAVVLSVCLFVAEALIEPFSSFDVAFEALAARQFVRPSDESTVAIVGYSILSAGTIWMSVSTVALLWFKRWARFGFWASLPVSFAGIIVAEGYRPSYTSPLGDWLSFIDAGLVGAVLLMAYAKGLGANWFAKSPRFIED